MVWLKIWGLLARRGLGKPRAVTLSCSVDEVSSTTVTHVSALGGAPLRNIGNNVATSVVCSSASTCLQCKLGAALKGGTCIVTTVVFQGLTVSTFVC